MVSSSLLVETTSRTDCGVIARPDSDLVYDAQCGDSFAFVELCRRHSGRLLWRLHRITRNRQDAEDALQDTLLSAYRNLNRFENRSAFSSWLTAIAINYGLMTLRRRRPVLAVSLDEAVDFSPSVDLPGGRHGSVNPERQYEGRERQLLVDRAIRCLPRDLRVVMELRVVHDRSIEEIAQNLDISHSAVKSRLGRGRARMRNSLADMGIKAESTSASRERNMPHCLSRPSSETDPTLES